jgi:geranylgeranyl reductase family protein
MLPNQNPNVDAAIIGGGPAGSLAAILLGKEHEVTIFEEHQTAGFPVQCAGLISRRCFEKLKSYCKAGKAKERDIEGAFFFSPSGHKTIEAKGEAVVVERKILDGLLFQKASERAETFIKEKASFEGFKVKTSKREFDPEAIIGADGVYSETARHFSFPRFGIFTTLQVEVKFEPLDEDFVELYFGRTWSNSFFAYAIPLGDTARIGIISRDKPEFYLRNLIEKHPSVSKRVKGSIIELNAGAIPDRLVNFSKGKVALIGDAAGMVKPYTGGGLFYLLVAAEKLAQNFPNLKKYEELYMREMGNDYRFGYLVRKLYSLSDEKMEKLFTLMADFDFKGVHMDSPSTLSKKAAGIAFRLLKDPKLAFFILKSLLS